MTSASTHLPSATQRLLLHAVLSPERAIEYWQRWRECVLLDDIDHGSLRLLPMLDHTLRQHGVQDPELARYRGVLRKSWVENQLIFRRTEQVIDTLQRAGIPVVVLKGIPLAHRYYPKPGLRPMADGDILVRFDDAAAAIDRLCDAGWVPVDDYRRDDLKSFVIHKQHGINFHDARGNGLDLHWRVLGLVTPVEMERHFWESAEPITLGAVKTRTLSAADHLLHCCVHGVVWNAVPALRWVIDAMLIIRQNQGTLDWNRLVEMSRRQRLGLFVTEALSYLDSEYEAGVPETVLRDLARQSVASWQRTEFRLMTSSDRLAMRDYYVRHRFMRMRATIKEWGDPPIWRAWIRFLRIHWELERSSQVFLRIVNRSFTKCVTMVRDRFAAA